MKNHILVIALGLTIVGSAASAQNITVQLIANNATGLFLDSDEQGLGNTGYARVGTFGDLSGVDLTSYSEVDAVFTEFANFTSASGQFAANQSVSNQGSAGQDLFVWVFNDTDAENASEWGIFGAAPNTWEVAIAGGTSNLVSSQIADIILGGTTGGGPTNYTLSAVPEPSAAAALAGLLALGYVMVRRREA